MTDIKEDYPHFKAFEFRAIIQIPARDLEEATIKMRQLMGLLHLPYAIEPIGKDHERDDNYSN